MSKLEFELDLYKVVKNNDIENTSILASKCKDQLTLNDLLAYYAPLPNIKAKIIKILLENGADPFDDLMILFKVCDTSENAEQLKKVKLLLKYGIDINESGNNKITPLHALLKQEVVNKKLAFWMIENNAKI